VKFHFRRLQNVKKKLPQRTHTGTLTLPHIHTRAGERVETVICIRVETALSRSWGCPKTKFWRQKFDSSLWRAIRKQVARKLRPKTEQKNIGGA